MKPIDRRTFVSGLGVSGVSLLASQKPSSAAFIGGRSAGLVMAWYNLSFGLYGSTQAAYQEEFEQIQNYGVDVLVLDMFGWNPTYTAYFNYQTAAAAAFAAAAAMGTNFKLCFAFDWIGGSEPASDAGLMMTAYGNHPNYFYYLGKPFLSSFKGSINTTTGSSDNTFVSAALASVASAGFTPFFCPYFGLPGFSANNQSSTNAAALAAFNGGWLPAVCNGLMGWSDLIPALNAQRNASELYVTSNQAPPILAVPSVTSWFGIIRFLYLNENAEFLEYNGYEGMSTLWAAAIAQAPPLVIIVTWNDYTETYCGPGTTAQLATAAVPSYWQVSSTFLNGHAGFAEMHRYWIAQYKAGQALTPGQDLMLVAYRTAAQSVAAADYTGTISWNAQVYNATLDDLYITTVCTAAATLQVSTGGNVTNTAVPAGVAHTRIPFSVGAQTFALIRAAATLISITGANVVATLTDQTNMNPVTYFGYGV